MTYQNVKEARIAAGFTQKEFAEKLEIPLRTVSDWERGLRNPPCWTCKLLIMAITLSKQET